MNDEPSLAEIESWWARLACGIARSSPSLTLHEVELAARQAVGLVVFLRMCGQRGLLSGRRLDTLTAANGAGCRLDELLKLAQHRLGSGLFHLPTKSDEPSVKEAGLPTLRIDDETLLAAISPLYTPRFALDLGARPVEFLGRIHERLLGKRLRRGPGGRLRVESSPEAKRKGGVFYTPAYIAQYIVGNSVGPRLEGEPPKPADDFDLEILDPACGCGSFLLAACRYLLAWLRRRQLPQAARIVANHVHGVDVDPEAVLAARRSLWLELVAGRPHFDARSRAGELAARGIVDEITENVRCGDALSDSAAGQSAGRFDAVVGNPPYRRELNSKHLLDGIAASELGRRHRTPRMDLWYYFVHRSLELLKPGGKLSFIVGSYWTSGRGSEKLIRTLRESAHVEEIFLLDGLSVFPNVSGRHMILTVTKGAGCRPTTIKRAAATGRADAEPFVRGTGPVAVFRKTAGQLFRAGRIDVEPPCDGLLAKLARWTPLGALGKVRQGIAENPAAVTRKTNERHGSPWKPGEGVFALTPAELARLNVPEREMRLVRPYHDLCDLGRYFLAREPTRRLIYSTPKTCPAIDRYPALSAHLARFRPIMEARRETRKGVRPWWQLHWPREESLWQSPKIISLQMARRPAFVPAAVPVYVPFSANVFVPRPDSGEHLNYTTALLNSRLVWKWYRHHAKRRGVGLEINGHVLAQTPIRTIDFSNARERARHDRLVVLVDRLLRLNRQSREAPDAERTEIARQIGDTDRRLDSLVYGLYGLTDTEIATVEAVTRDRG